MNNQRKLIFAGSRPPKDIGEHLHHYATWLWRLVDKCATFNDEMHDVLIYTRFHATDGRVYDHPSSIRLYDFDIGISGKAYGGDHAGEIVRDRMGWEAEDYPANWQAFGKRAGMIRNLAMADAAGENGELYLVWDGKSPGSANMRQIMLDRGRPVYENVIEDWRLGL